MSGPEEGGQLLDHQSLYQIFYDGSVEIKSISLEALISIHSIHTSDSILDVLK